MRQQQRAAAKTTIGRVRTRYALQKLSDDTRALAGMYSYDIDLLFSFLIAFLLLHVFFGGDRYMLRQRELAADTL
jgi:hypothetical protein